MLLNGWPEVTDEQKMVLDQIGEFAKKEIAPKAADFDKTGGFPTEIVKQLGELGLMGMMRFLTIG